VDRLPPLPAAVWFGTMDAAVVDRRREGLREFLHALVAMDGARDLDLVQIFLQTPVELLEQSDPGGEEEENERNGGDQFRTSMAFAPRRMPVAAAERLQHEWNEQVGPTRRIRDMGIPPTGYGTKCGALV
jgi:hypothetical protein